MLRPLITFDFDGTIANTFEPSPRGIDVSTAYQLAIRNIFGQIGLRIYEDHLGGLKNRAPRELVLEILRVAEEKSVPFLLREDTISDPVGILTRRLVYKKLAFLLGEISLQWPHLYEGAEEFFRAVENQELPVEVAIVSSGHDEFIQKVFEVNGLVPPRNLVTSDLIESLKEPKRVLYKPAPYQLARAHHRWLTTNHDDFIKNGKYVGRERQTIYDACRRRPCKRRWVCA